MRAVGLGEAGDAHLGHQPVKRGAVQVVQARPRQLAAPHAVHRRRVGGPPLVDERRPIGLDPTLLAERAELGDQAAAPVDHAAEHVEHQGFR